MSNNEPNENTEQLNSSDASTDLAQSSAPAAVGSKMALIGAVPLILFLIFVVLAAVGVGSVIVGAILFVLGAIGYFFMWKGAQGALSSSLNALRDEAFAVANEDLPGLGKAISTGAPVTGLSNNRKAATFQDAEFQAVAGSLTAVRESAAGLGDNVAALQSGISDTYVNLARRNQALVDRQLEAIDTLEAEERDSDRLSLLYRVDHLATRMHRNAESLLVLADAKTPERHSPAVALREVLRVAIGEVEDYRRIVPISLDEFSIAGHKAQDMAHLLAELMENSAQHSPPGTAVDVTGTIDNVSGDYTITILDHGTGLAPDQLQQLNTLLSEPPKSTLTISHSIGLQVVSRIAHSLGINVKLAHGEDGGVVTAVGIPSVVVQSWSQVVPGATAEAPAAAPGAAPPSVAAAPAAAAPVAPAILPESAPPAHAEPAAPDGPLRDPIADFAGAATMPSGDLDSPAPIRDLATSTEPAPAHADSPDPAHADPASFPTVGADQPAEGSLPLESLTDPAAPASDDQFQMPLPQPVAEAPAPAEVAEAPAEPVEPEPEPDVFIPGNSTFEMPGDTSVADAPAAEAPAPAEATIEPPAAPLVGAAAAAAAPAVAGAAPQPGKTASGLTKRTRSAVKTATPLADLDEGRTGPSQRSPDQVKSMLSRYKSGLERGRGPAETDGE